MAWIQRVLAWTQYISSSGLWNNTHDVDRVYICSARLGQRSAWLAPTERRTGGATSLCGHLTRSCSFGRGHVWLYCHSWSGMCGPCHILCGPTVTQCHTLSHIVWPPLLLVIVMGERDVACSRHATPLCPETDTQGCHKQAYTCLL